MDTLRQVIQKRAQERRIAFEIGWKLKQHDTQLVFQPRNGIAKKVHGFRAVAQSRKVGHLLRRLEGKLEAFWRRLRPGANGLLARDPTKGVVDLRRRKMVGVESQHFAGGVPFAMSS